MWKEIRETESFETKTKERRKRTTWMKKYPIGSQTSTTPKSLLIEVASLPLKMLEGKAVVRETDMPEVVQNHVMELAYQALDAHEVSDCQSIAYYIKQKLDEAYGPAWNSVVGKDFGSCITHLCGSFIFFRVEMMEFLIFKDGKDFSENREEAIGVQQKSKN